MGLCSRSPTEQDNTCVFNIQHKHTWKKGGVCRSSYHAGAVAVVAVLDFGAWLVALAVAALAGCVYVNGELFVDSLCCLSECQLHDVLCREKEKLITLNMHQ